MQSGFPRDAPTLARRRRLRSVRRGRLYQREDDRPESVKLLLEVYENSTAPLIKFYRELGLLVPATATGSPEEIAPVP